MSWITWAMILTGVGLNAAAQMMLKLASRPLAHFNTFDWTTVQGSVMSLARSPAFWVGMVCYGTSSTCLAGRALQGAGEHGLSDVVAGLRGGGLGLGGLVGGNHDAG